MGPILGIDVSSKGVSTWECYGLHLWEGQFTTGVALMHIFSHHRTTSSSLCISYLYMYLYLSKNIQSEFILFTTTLAMIRPLSHHKTTTWLYQDFKVSVSVLFFMKVIITKTENSNRIHLDRTRYQHKTISWFSQDCNV